MGKEVGPPQTFQEPQEPKQLVLSQFVDPDTLNEWIVLSEPPRIIQAFGIDDRVTGDGFRPPGQVLSSALGDLFPPSESPVLHSNVRY